MDWLGLIVFIIYILLFVVLGVAFVRLRVLYGKLVAKNYNDEFEKEVLVNKLYQVMQEQSVQDVEKTDGFLRFVSESRDWAFEYIEDVQASILYYQKALSQEDADAISKALEKLMSFLPEENNSPEHD
jgi:hypothetical protein